MLWLIGACLHKKKKKNTLFDEPHFTRRTFLPQAEAVAALGAADGGVLWGDPALAPRHSLHLPLLLLVGEGALPLLALRRCVKRQERDKLRLM